MLIIKDIVKYFGRGTVNEVLALNGLDLSVKPGEFVCIIGSNGAGKSSLLGNISGAVIPDSGSIMLDGLNVTAWPEYKRARYIGRVFQDPLFGTCASMSIEENMALAHRRGKRRSLAPGVRKAERDVFREALAKLDLGLEQRLKDSVGLLSGGQRQALTMIMSTLVRPKLLLLDEHTAALDPKTAGLIMDLTREIVARESLTTLMITHNMQQALCYGNRLLMMHQGKIIMDLDEKAKAGLKVTDLLQRFQEITPDDSLSDRMMLS